MKAIVSRGSGSADKLILSEVEKPIPKDKELLIKVHAGTVTRGDVFLRKIPAFIVVPLGFLLEWERTTRLDAVGKISKAKCKGSLKENGKYRSIRPPRRKGRRTRLLKTLAEAGRLLREQKICYIIGCFE
jgi:NADPH:quinone reductase-like Zn-dependent oxidoreductase